MKLKLQNSSGMVRHVPTGFSWTGFFFQYFVLFARGLFSRAILLLCLALFLQIAGCVFQLSAGLAAASEGQDVSSTMSSASMFFLFVVFLPFALIIGFKINKWTARYWLDHGYKPVGPGWQEWGPKWGLDASALPSE
jgi:hypothetical protein